MKRLIPILLAFSLWANPCWGGVTFDKVDDFLNIATPVDDTYPFSYACWVKSDDETVGQTVLSIGEAGNDDAFHRMALQGNAGGDPLRCHSIDTSSPDTGSEFADTSSGYSANTWHHVACVFAASNDRRAFIDGGNKGTNSGGVIVDNADVTRIGRRAANTSSQTMSGVITECTVWNVALTDAEVAILASTRVKRFSCQIQPTLIVDAWAVDDCADGVSCDGTSFVPVCGSGNDAFIGNDGANNSGLTGAAEEILSYQ